MKVNINNPFVFVGLGMIAVLAAGILMNNGRRLPLISDAKKGF